VGFHNNKIDQSEKISVAKYVRMSTVHQKYSTENQSRFIDEYADSHNMEVVKTYIDSGKSGLRLKGRLGFQQLLSDIEAKQHNFEAVLIYDISRWGRFQNTTEGAHYEFLCTSAGVRLIFCAEVGLENYGSIGADVLAAIKRSMAAEYSRELSKKVFIGQSHLISLGFRQGGSAGFGLKRLLIDANGAPKGCLNRGERKSLQTDRVILIPSSDDEIRIICDIYHWFIFEQKTEKEIAHQLNQQGIKTDLDRAWTRGTVHQILTNEKYIGHNVYNRLSYKLKIERTKNPYEEWIRKNHSFEAVVPEDLFSQAKSIIAARSTHIENEQLLSMLDHLWKTKGTLSGLIIDEQDDMPSSSIYRSKFGGLLKAYTLIGFIPERDYQYIEINKQLRVKHSYIVDEIIGRFEQVGADIERNQTSKLIRINDEWDLSLIIARCIHISENRNQWWLRFEGGLRPDITVAVRMDHNNINVLDYFIIPHIDIYCPSLKIVNRNKLGIDAYRHDSLSFLYELATRVRLDEVV
jgi:DNA invertase Pin-like site-specific DNA recombinase